MVLEHAENSVVKGVGLCVALCKAFVDVCDRIAKQKRVEKWIEEVGSASSEQNGLAYVYVSVYVQKNIAPDALSQ